MPHLTDASNQPLSKTMNFQPAVKVHRGKTLGKKLHY